MAGIGFTGRKHSEETKAHWSKIRKGRAPHNKGVSRPTPNSARALLLLGPNDQHLLDRHCWHIDTSTGYARARVDGRIVKLHQLILDAPMVDHINGNKLDNRRYNLRPCTQTTNQQNRKVGQKNNKSGYKGVSWHKTKHKWHANIRINKVLKHLGYFDDVKEAAQTYNLAALEHFGEYARINEVTI